MAFAKKTAKATSLAKNYKIIERQRVQIMKRFKIMASLLLATTIMISTGCAGGSANNTPEGTPPDYSNSTLQFEFYGYSGPSNGNYNEYGVSYNTGEDFRTVERFREYKDSGMTLNFPQTFAAYSGITSWEESEAKHFIGVAAEAGLERTILTDWRIARISKVEGGLIGEGKKYSTEADLDAYIEDCLNDYIDDVNIYGVMLGDEPVYNALKSYGEVYKSIKRVAKKFRDEDFFIHANLIGCFNSTNATKWYGELPEDFDTTGMAKIDIIYAQYANYVETYFEETGADYVQYDSYPLNEGSIGETHVVAMKLVANICKKLNKDFWFINQTMNMLTSEGEQRYMTEADARWVNNLSIGFGAEAIGYFTYWRKADNDAREYFNDYASFISQYGEKTNLYYSMQKIMAEEQKLAPTILNFRYNASAIYTMKPTQTLTNYCSGFVNDDFTALSEVEINKEAALVTELYDKNKGNYMYMVQNMVDPLNQGSSVYQTSTLKFDEKYKSAVVIYRGESKLVALKNSLVSFKLNPGDAVFVIPY